MVLPARGTTGIPRLEVLKAYDSRVAVRPVIVQQSSRRLQPGFLLIQVRVQIGGAVLVV